VCHFIYRWLAGASSSLQMVAHNLTLTFKRPGWFLNVIAWFNLNRKRYSYDKWHFMGNKTDDAAS